MNLISVDVEKCLHDGICSGVCPQKLIRFDEEKKIPYAIEGAEKICHSCGHCVAICPNGALKNSNFAFENCKEINDNWRLSPEEASQFIKGRRSVRRFKDKEVAKEILEQILDITSYAPTGFNSQPVEWIIIKDANEVKRLTGMVIEFMRGLLEAQNPMALKFGFSGFVNDWDAGIDPICYSAPHLVLAIAPRDLPISQGACTTALSYLELAALPFGLGTCWAGFFQIAVSMSKALQDALKIPENYQSFGTLMIGYPKHEFHRIPVRKEPKIYWQ